MSEGDFIEVALLIGLDIQKFNAKNLVKKLKSMPANITCGVMLVNNALTLFSRKYNRSKNQMQ